MLFAKQTYLPRSVPLKAKLPQRTRQFISAFLILWSQDIAPEQPIPQGETIRVQTPTRNTSLIPSNTSGHATPRALVPTKKGPTIPEAQFIRAFKNKARRELISCLENIPLRERKPVLLSAVIDRGGNVKNLKSLSAQEKLSPCAERAILRMNFEELTGEFPVNATVTVHWRLDP